METELIREAIDHITTRMAKRQNGKEIHWTQMDTLHTRRLVECCEQFLTELEMGFIDLSKSACQAHNFVV